MGINAFSSITSSSLTTFVGLLTLVFMSFKIGTDMGIALAKSVLISLICIFIVLPALILMSDKIIDRLKKKALHIPMEGYAKFSEKLRYVFGVLFVCLFAGVFFLKSGTEISYSLEGNNKVDIVRLYHTEDSKSTVEIANYFKDDENIKSIAGYANTLGLAYASNEFAAVMQDMGEIMGMDASEINLIYYSTSLKGVLLS